MLVLLYKSYRAMYNNTFDSEVSFNEEVTEGILVQWQPDNELKSQMDYKSRRVGYLSTIGCVMI